MNIRHIISLIPSLLLVSHGHIDAQKIDANPNTSIELQWMPLTADRAYLEDVLENAREYQVDGFQVSHRLLHNIDEIVYPEKERKNISSKVDFELLEWFLKELEKYEMDAHLWTHELVGPPETAIEGNKVVIDHPTLYPFMLDKYAKAQQMVPSMKSIVVTFNESEYRAYDDRQSTAMKIPDNAASRTRQLVNYMLEIGENLVVDVVFRGNFVDTDAMYQAVDQKFIFMAKNSETDWHPYAPMNDFITHPPKGVRELWVEFDLGMEHTLRNAVPYLDAERIVSRLQEALKHGVQKVAVRLDRFGGDDQSSAIYTPWGQLGLQIFSAFKSDPGFSLELLIDTWEKKHFEGAYELISLCTEATKLLLHPKMMQYANHSAPPSYEFAIKHIYRYDKYGIGHPQRCAVSQNSSPEEGMNFLRNAFRCHQPDPAWYASINEDLDHAESLISKAMQLIQDNAAQIEDPIWNESVNLLNRWSKVFRLNQQIYFGLRLLRFHPQALNPKEMKKKIEVFDLAVDKLESDYKDKPFSQVGTLVWKIRNSQTVNGFMQELENAMISMKNN